MDDDLRAYKELRGLLFSVPPKPVPEELLFRIHDALIAALDYIEEGVKAENAYVDGYNEGYKDGSRDGYDNGTFEKSQL